MTIRDIIRQRLYNQQLAQSGFKTPGEVVKWLGAVQAQDYYGSLWAVGQRIEHAVESDIEKAIADKTIVRTWPMRGTLHYASPEDVRWMLKLLTPRVISRSAGIYRAAELNTTTFKKSAKILERALRDGKRLTRNEMYETLQKGKVSPEGLRGLHILGHLAQEGLICHGPRKGKQPTFTLLDDWLPPAKTLQRDEALSKLTLNYFTGHGPATVQDFVWWSGITIADAKKGLDIVKSELAEEAVNGNTYWLSPSLHSGKNIPKQALLLPTYDEYTVAYKDRDNLVSPEGAEVLKKLRNVVFTSAIIIGGLVVGIWKRTLQKDHVEIDVTPLIRFDKAQKNMIAKAAKKYGKFLGLPVKLR